MIDVYVLDKDLNVAGVIDSYKSMIWANRYNDIGDCELYLDASSEDIELLKMGYYLMRKDDDMICQIRRIDIETSEINGNYLAVYGVDVKAMLDQRIIWFTEQCEGNLESFIRKIVNEGCSSSGARGFRRQDGTQLIILGNPANFTVAYSEQVSYKNIGEKIREYCKRFNWGYRFTMVNRQFVFGLYAGKNLANKVVFSNDFENLSATKYTDDKMNMGNVGIIAGSGEGFERVRSQYGNASSVDRFEIYVDAKDISQQISYEQLLEAYPLIESGGTGYLSGTDYMVTTLNVLLVDDTQLAWLVDVYPLGRIVYIDRNRYFQIQNVKIATLDTEEPENNSPVILEEVVYTVFLLNRGAEKIAEYGEVVSFEGSVVPDITFVYKDDYSLGDIVSVRNEFDISANARIVEVVEVLDDTGYRVEPKFQYVEVV